MDAFDLFVPSGPEPASGGSRRESFLGGVVVFGLPLAYLILLTVTDLTKDPGLALLKFPTALTALGALVCALGGVSFRRSFVAVVGCLWWCLVAGLTMVVIDIMIFPF
jgi:hypothetical protein